MPSHIFVRLGLWPESIASNLDSVRLGALGARTHTRRPPPSTSSMPSTTSSTPTCRPGRTTEAKARRGARERRCRDVREADDFAAAYALAAIPVRLALERGDWEAAARLPDPMPPEALSRISYVAAIPAYGRAIGAARSGDLARAEAEIARLAELQAKLAAIAAAGTLRLGRARRGDPPRGRRAAGARQGSDDEAVTPADRRPPSSTPEWARAP